MRRGGSTGIPLVRYHEPSAGWTARVPADWPSAGIGPQFIRGRSVKDATVLALFTYRRHSPSAAVHELTALGEFHSPRAAGTRRAVLTWQRYRSSVRGDPALTVELAVARRGSSTYVAALVARRAELGRLTKTVLLPTLDSFVPGSPDARRSVLARRLRTVRRRPARRAVRRRETCTSCTRRRSPSPPPSSASRSTTRPRAARG